MLKPIAMKSNTTLLEGVAAIVLHVGEKST